MLYFIYCILFKIQVALLLLIIAGDVEQNPGPGPVEGKTFLFIIVFYFN